MNFGDYLTVKQIIPEMTSGDSMGAITELVGRLVASGRLRAVDEEAILAGLRAREETMSTGIGFGFAMPHAASDRVEGIVAAFGRSVAGIDFCALDGKPAEFVFLWICPKKQPVVFPWCHKTGEPRNDDAVAGLLRTARTAEEILEVLRRM